MKALEKQKPNDEQQDSDDEKIKFATSLAPNRFARIDIFRALDSFRREFKRPGKNHRHGKSDNEQQHYKTHRPIRNFEERKNLTRDLHQQPCDDCVGDRNFVNVASLQLSEEILRVHGDDPFFGAKTLVTSSSKRGSPRSGSSNGSTLMYLSASPARS